MSEADETVCLACCLAVLTPALETLSLFQANRDRTLWPDGTVRFQPESSCIHSRFFFALRYNWTTKLYYEAATHSPIAAGRRLYLACPHLQPVREIEDNPEPL